MTTQSQQPDDSQKPKSHTGIRILLAFLFISLWLFCVWEIYSRNWIKIEPLTLLLAAIAIPIAPIACIFFTPSDIMALAKFISSKVSGRIRGKTDFLISYTIFDYRWARWIKEQLESESRTVTLFDWNGEDDFIEMMQMASNQGKHIIHIISLDYLYPLQQQDHSHWYHFFKKDCRRRDVTSVAVNDRAYKELRSIPKIKRINLAEKGLKAPSARDRLLQRFLQNNYSQPKQGLNFPGALPDNWNIPRPSTFFTGRIAILNDLYNNFKKDGIQTIYGLGGIGKTQVAMAYAHNQLDKYQYGLWLHLFPHKRHEADLREIGRLLGLADALIQDTDVANLKKAIMNWLNTHEDWLLVLDGCNDQRNMKEFISQTRGHTLLTSSITLSNNNAQQVQVREMDTDEGALFLLRRAGIILPDESFIIASEGNREAALAISKTMGGVPRALEVAGVFVYETKCSLDRYLVRYANERNKLTEKFKELLANGAISDEDETVLYSWSIAWEKIQKTAPAAAELLAFCAFLGPDSIPIEIIKKAVVQSANFGTPNTLEGLLDDAIGELRRFSLIDRENDTLKVNRHVQDILRDTMDKSVFDLLAERAVLTVIALLPRVNSDNWLNCQQYESHVQAFIKLIENNDPNFPKFAPFQTALLFDWMGCYLREAALYKDAEQYLERALDMRQKITPQDDLGIATSKNNLAELYHLLGQYSKAEGLYQVALIVRKNLPQPEDTEIAVILNNQGRLYEDWGTLDNSEVRKLYEQACQIRQDAIQRNQDAVTSDLAASWSNIAQTYYCEGNFLEAKKSYKEATRTYEEMPGGKKFGEIQIHAASARIEVVNKQYDLAEVEYRQALEIGKQYFGKYHPVVASRFNNLGELYRVWKNELRGEARKEKEAQARNCFDEALEIYRHIYGKNSPVNQLKDFPVHPAVVSVLLNKASLLEYIGRSYEPTVRWCRAKSEEITDLHRKEQEVTV